MYAFFTRVNGAWGEALCLFSFSLCSWCLACCLAGTQCSMYLYEMIDDLPAWMEKTFESAWTARKSNQSILKEMNPEYPLEGLMLKLKLQYFGHLMQRVDSFEKTLILGKIEGRQGDDRGWDGWNASPTWWMYIWVDSGSWWWTGRPVVLWFMGSQNVGHNWAT